MTHRSAKRRTSLRVLWSAGALAPLWRLGVTKENLTKKTMGGAILVTTPGFALLTRHRSHPFFSDTFRIPTRSGIDSKLLIGAAIFGIGWGLGGFCPGPALTALPLLAKSTFIFVPAMLVGLLLGHRVNGL